MITAQERAHFVRDLRTGKIDPAEAVAQLSVPEQIDLNEHVYATLDACEEYWYDATFGVVQDSALLLAASLALLALSEDTLMRVVSARTRDDTHLRRVEWQARYGGDDESL